MKISIFLIFVGKFSDICAWNDKYLLYDKKNNELLVKDQDEEDPETLLDIEGSRFVGRTIRVDPEDPDWVFLNKEGKSILVYNTDTEEEYEIPKTHGSVIVQHEVLPGNKLAYLKENGCLVIRKYSHDKNASKMVTETQLEELDDRDEKSVTFCACPNGRYFVVHTMDEEKTFSRLIVFELEKDGLVELDVLDLMDSEIKYMKALSFLKYYGNSFVIIGVKWSENSKSCILGFVYKEDELDQIDLGAQKTKLSNVFRLEKVGQQLFGIDKGVKLFRIDP